MQTQSGEKLRNNKQVPNSGDLDLGPVPKKGGDRVELGLVGITSLPVEDKIFKIKIWEEGIGVPNQKCRTIF